MVYSFHYKRFKLKYFLINDWLTENSSAFLMSKDGRLRWDDAFVHTVSSSGMRVAHHPIRKGHTDNSRVHWHDAERCPVGQVLWHVRPKAGHLVLNHSHRLLRFPLILFAQFHLDSDSQIRDRIRRWRCAASIYTALRVFTQKTSGESFFTSQSIWSTWHMFNGKILHL